jgi:hypothetical protein
MPELKVGDNRKFEFDERTYKIREIIELPGVKMRWRWDTGVCPHCKHRLTHEIDHEFIRIEVLGTHDKADNQLTKADITLMGDTTDGKRLIITQEKYAEVLGKTKKFKHIE